MATQANPRVEEERFEVDGEVRQAVDASALTLITSAEIDMQIATAKRYPRDLSKVKRRMWDLIGQDVQTAGDCIYALPRREKNEATGRWEQKVIKGPTVRFAESMMNAWGNSRSGARIVSEEEQFIVAQGVFHDLESNVVVNIEVRKRIVNRHGERYNADMIVVTANAACSTALRNAILRGIPQPMWRGAFQAAQEAIAGNVKTLAERRDGLIKQFAAFGMTQAMVLQTLGLASSSDIALDHLVVLQGTLTALQDGDVTVETLMSEDTAVAEKGRTTVEQIKKKYQKPATEKAPAENLDAEPAPETVRDQAEKAQKKVDQRKQTRDVVPEGW